MKDVLTAQDALPLAQKVAADLEANYATVTGLDQQVGDGDLGITCRLGMNAIIEILPELADASLDQMVLKSGMKFNSAGASTYGALVASATMGAGKYAKDNSVAEWDLASMAAATRAAAEAIEKRGKASRGEGTMLDALWPAIEALEAGQADGTSMAEAFAKAADAAAEGLEATKPLKAKYGRAAWLQDKTIGVQDPGATVVAIVFKAIAGYLAE